MTERPQVLEIGAHSFGDEACAFNLIGLPSLQLCFQTCNGKVEEGIGQADCSSPPVRTDSCMIASV